MRITHKFFRLLFGCWVALQIMHHLIIDAISQQRLQEEMHAIMVRNNETLTMSSPFRHFVAEAWLGIGD